MRNGKGLAGNGYLQNCGTQNVLLNPNTAVCNNKNE